MFPYPGPTQPYQVKPTDKDLLQIAAQQKIPYPDLKALNPSITSISTGQFINLPKIVPTAPKTPGAPGSAVYGPPAPSTIPYGPPKPSTMPMSSQASPYALAPQSAPPNNAGYLSNISNFEQAKIQGQNIVALKTTLETATDPSQLPNLVSGADAQAAGYAPEQMIAGGYRLQNGNWVKQGAPGTQGVPQSGNNWQTNSRLYMVQHGKYAHNRQNRYTETLHHAEVMAKKHRGRTKPKNPVRPDTPSTTLDVVLGS